MVKNKRKRDPQEEDCEEIREADPDGEGCDAQRVVQERRGIRSEVDESSNGIIGQGKEKASQGLPDGIGDEAPKEEE